MVKDLKEIGFSQVKLWEQPMNLMFKSAEEYLLKVGNQRLKTYATANKSTEKEIEELRKEVKLAFDEMCGENTTNSDTFQIVVVIAFKE